MTSGSHHDPGSLEAVCDECSRSAAAEDHAAYHRDVDADGYPTRPASPSTETPIAAVASNEAPGGGSNILGNAPGIGGGSVAECVSSEKARYRGEGKKRHRSGESDQSAGPIPRRTRKERRASALRCCRAGPSRRARAIRSVQAMVISSSSPRARWKRALLGMTPPTWNGGDNLSPGCRVHRDGAEKAVDAVFRLSHGFFLFRCPG